AVQAALPARHRAAHELGAPGSGAQGDRPPAHRAAGPRDRSRRGAGCGERGERLMAEATARKRGARKVREGVVVSNAMDKTAVVVVTTRKPHPLYKKTMVRSRRLYTHDENNELRVG